MIGTDINGYKVIEYCGQGSFGTVYKCTKNDEEYAIKIFLLEYVFKEFSRNTTHNRITQEIDSLTMIDHENVVKIINHGVFKKLDHEYVYLVMEYLDGDTLKTLVENYNQSELDFKIQVFNQLLTGVDAIHKSNIIHRDLKPENVFLTSNNEIKIVDFGLAKLIDFSSITNTGDQIGSPIYMSPEQIKDSKNIDYRSDYYGLGIILYQLLSGSHPYGHISSREELYYKIINEKPISILQFDPSLPNNIDNLLNHLLDKSNYNRPNNALEIKQYTENLYQKQMPEKNEFEPSFFLRLYNEKTILADFYKDGFSIKNAIFPINHQERQKGVLSYIQNNDVNFFIDPASMRLAYDTYADVKGLTNLAYAPNGYNRLELTDLDSLEKKRKYVAQVIGEQLRQDPKALVSPFHISNNSNLISIKNDSVENWFSNDIKLLKETKDYLLKEHIDLPLIGGFCIKSDILTSSKEQEYLLNVLSSLPCDVYWIYVDCIDHTSNSTQIFHYVKTLLTLQNITNKPVIAGRVNSIGLLLLSFGIYGFEAGTSRFESFYEGLYSEKSDPYNMYVMYYMPELLKNVPWKRGGRPCFFAI